MSRVAHNRISYFCKEKPVEKQLANELMKRNSFGFTQVTFYQEVGHIHLHTDPHQLLSAFNDAINCNLTQENTSEDYKSVFLS